ncbi:MAG: class I SAM-dependent methyltransferase [Lachnospiraceae bacterium]|jgi:23S rRNA (cytosine1962-C5)-methyltransferase|nr:class I SAM-dependent methyltransferase [Lachnospiraceae bacterium]MEE3462063.1 class I SAM-dependent methyltransferase [Lachnospiraceae bacterium]
MWKAGRWKDYEVLDASDGEKLERWGEYRLLRPDPQVIWHTKKDKKLWSSINAHYHRSSKGGGSWEFFDLPETWSIHYELPDGIELKFNIEPFKFKHTGLFPEQAANWDWFYNIIKEERDRHPYHDIKVLNLFAYTGGATLAALAAGAQVTHVDASKGMVGWAKENSVISGLRDRHVRWIVDDCTKFVEREIRRRNTYDAIIMDPPSYGRGPKGEIWKMEDNIYDFLLLSSRLLSDKPLFFLINSYTTGLQPLVLDYMTRTIIGSKFGGVIHSEEIGLPVTKSGLVLPCGASCRWERG